MQLGWHVVKLNEFIKSFGKVAICKLKKSDNADIDFYS